MNIITQGMIMTVMSAPLLTLVTFLVAGIFEGAGPARHAEILQTIFGEHGDLGRRAGRKAAFEARDAPFEKGRLGVGVAGDDGERAAKIDDLAVEVEKAHVGAVRAPVAKCRLAPEQARRRLFDEEGEQAVGEARLFLPVELDGRAGGIEA